MRYLTQDELSGVSGAKIYFEFKEDNKNIFILQNCGRDGGEVHFNNLTFTEHGCFKPGPQTNDNLMMQGEIFEGYQFMFENAGPLAKIYRLIPI